MDFLQVNTTSQETVIQSFNNIADKLFNDYKLQINDDFYRLLDIEFYFFAKGIYEDVHTHKSEIQLHSGKWYFHKSGIDLTIGNGVYHGGILLRGIMKFSNNPGSKSEFFEKEIHGPVNIKTEITSKFYGAFEDKCNLFRMVNIEKDRQGALMKSPSHVIKSKRIGLTSKAGDINDSFLNGNFRYQILLDGIAIDYKNKESIVKELLKSGKIDKSKAKDILGYNVTI